MGVVPIIVCIWAINCIIWVMSARMTPPPAMGMVSLMGMVWPGASMCSCIIWRVWPIMSMTWPMRWPTWAAFGLPASAAPCDVAAGAGSVAALEAGFV